MNDIEEIKKRLTDVEHALISLTAITKDGLEATSEIIKESYMATKAQSDVIEVLTDITTHLIDKVYGDERLKS